MDETAAMFFDHFGISPGRSAGDIHGIAEAFSNIPWENLTKFLLRASGSPRPRLPHEVMEGHLSRGTGGTCYSLTETLGTIVAECGLSARPLTGHMNHGRNIHCALLVEGDAGSFILDPGYAVPGAARLSSDRGGELALEGRTMRWKPVPGGWELHTIEHGQSRYRYTLESRVLSRAEFMEYWRRSFQAPGLESLHLNMPGPMGGRISAHNGNLRTVDPSGSRNLKLAADYGRLVSESFGIAREVAEAAWNELQRQKLARRGQDVAP
jgi:arylamine N-acetyltransferase